MVTASRWDYHDRIEHMPGLSGAPLSRRDGGWSDISIRMYVYVIRTGTGEEKEGAAGYLNSFLIVWAVV